MTYTTRPLSDRTWLNKAGRTPTRFQSKWAATLGLLEVEVTHLKGRDLVIEVDVFDSDLRLDGTIRARAQAASPGVVVAFESKHGPLLYRCDRFYAQFSGQPDDWQQNVRAIALTLQALRAVDRYGATETGQQYTGWAAITSTAHASPNDPLAIMRDLAGVQEDDRVDTARLISLARRNAHPDTGGTTETWDRFAAAFKAQIKAKGVQA